jgi:hypothetical protein
MRPELINHLLHSLKAAGAVDKCTACAKAIPFGPVPRLLAQAGPTSRPRVGIFPTLKLPQIYYRSNLPTACVHLVQTAAFDRRARCDQREIEKVKKSMVTARDTEREREREREREKEIVTDISERGRTCVHLV